MGSGIAYLDAKKVTYRLKTLDSLSWTITAATGCFRPALHIWVSAEVATTPNLAEAGKIVNKHRGDHTRMASRLADIHITPHSQIVASECTPNTYAALADVTEAASALAALLPDPPRSGEPAASMIYFDRPARVFWSVQRERQQTVERTGQQDVSVWCGISLTPSINLSN